MTVRGVDLILVPYDSGRRGVRMGAGPESLAVEILAHGRALGHAVAVRTVECTLAFPPEAAAAFHLAGAVAAAVRASAAKERFPLVLTGNCVSAAGVVAGLAPNTTGVVWFDAHADFNTPETSLSGFLDGMALAIVTGRCWSAAASAIPEFHCVPESFTVLIGARDFDPEEQRLLAGASVGVVGPDALRAGALTPALARIARHVSSVYVHIDLDVLDPRTVGQANTYPVGRGLSVSEVCATIEQVRRTFDIPAAALSAYDPAADVDGRVRAAVPTILETLLAAPALEQSV